MYEIEIKELNSKILLVKKRYNIKAVQRLIKKRPEHLPEQFRIRPSSQIAINSFTHATAIGVPPRVPTHVIDGTPSCRINSFDLAAFTNPTGVPTISAGRTPYSTSLHTVSAADGAFPITMIAPSSFSLHAIEPAEVLVIPYSCARRAPSSSSSMHLTSQLCPVLLIPTIAIFTSIYTSALFLIAFNPASIGVNGRIKTCKSLSL